jgi:hypothetical protein
MITTVVAIGAFGVAGALLATPASAHVGAWRHGHGHFGRHYQHHSPAHFGADRHGWHGHSWHHCGDSDHPLWRHHHRWQPGSRRQMQPPTPVVGRTSTPPNAPAHVAAPPHHPTQPRHHQTHRVQTATHRVQTVRPSGPTLVARRTTPSSSHRDHQPVRRPQPTRPQKHTVAPRRKHIAAPHPKQAPKSAPQPAPKSHPEPQPKHLTKPRALEVRELGGLDTHLVLTIMGAVALVTLVAMSYLVAIGHRKGTG